MKSSRVHTAAWVVLLSSAVLVLGLWGPGTARALPAGRVYEQVSPEFKGGYGVNAILGVEPGGEGVAFSSLGIFAGTAGAELGSQYEASRTATGWSTVALQPPSSMAPASNGRGFTPSLNASLWEMNLGDRNLQSLNNAVNLAVHARGAPDTQAGFQVLGPTLQSLSAQSIGVDTANVVGFSVDFCHVVLAPGVPLLAEAEGSKEQLYDVSLGCHSEPPYTRVVTLNSSGGPLSPVCVSVLGNGNGDRVNAVSGDGSEIFFQVRAATEAPLCLGGGGRQLFVRVGGQRTLEVSKPLGECTVGEVPCGSSLTRPRAEFVGASEDGSRVFFHTAAPLDPASDLDTSENLYMARIGCPGEAAGCQAGQRVVTGLVEVSQDPHAGQAAEVQGAVGVAPDGSRVYFVARGQLSQASNEQGLTAIEGADNLYVYDSVTSQMAFIGDLCSGPAVSGAVPDPSCPADLQEQLPNTNIRNDANLWQEYPRNFAQTTGGDGRFLAFSTYARLITTGPEADADDAQDVYLYDAQTGVLRRVSIGEVGYDSNGNHVDGEALFGPIDELGGRIADARVSPLTDAIEQEERGEVRRAISEDGSRVVFSTPDPLSPGAVNDQVNVYEWHEGAVAMLSCGCASEPDTEPVITPSGGDVFFNTTADLAAGDTDGARDIYDARLGGGFAPVPVPAERCEGDACQGPLMTPAPLLVPGSAVQTPGENASAAKPIVAGQAKHRTCTKKRSCAKHKRQAHGKASVRRPHRKASAEPAAMRNGRAGR